MGLLLQDERNSIFRARVRQWLCPDLLSAHEVRLSLLVEGGNTFAVFFAAAGSFLAVCLVFQHLVQVGVGAV